MRPRIGITSDRHPVDEGIEQYYDRARGAYSWCVAESGGVPFILPTPRSDPDLIATYLDLSDGVLFSGGGDIHPSFYREVVLEKCGPIDETRDHFEIELLRGALERGMPVLGVCRGMQLIAVALGGSLYQDLSYCQAAGEIHGGAWQSGGEMPSVSITPGTVLHQIIGEESLPVNCQHHQLVKALDQTCTVNAVTPDGMIEGIEVSGRSFAVGVHWHPERLAARDRRHMKLFEALVDAALRYPKG
ncbi:MAG: gamma-glutamyl-gamma-aminobutyrate hydrolase family protein [candidate division NC10 bacterium]|nr:gamma-glutamyl-gamma-aminobutyrate hydrolase family protein [candidate division NC10 bacterium]